jgi:hypothetical protein
MAKFLIRQSLICLFCEDIREEKGSPSILIGIFPDTLVLQSFPSMMSKLALYVRGHFPATKPPPTMVARLEATWEPKIIPLGQIEKGLIDTSTLNAKHTGNDIVGLILSGVFSPFPIQSPGRLDAIVTIDKTDFLAGTLKFVQG